MKRFFRHLDTLYCFIIFFLGFLISFPFFLLIIKIKSWRSMTYRVNYFWARWFFILSFIRVKIETEEKLDPSKQYIFCPNHTSYLDIPIMGHTYWDYLFVGKHDLGSVPLFGYMFSNLHISVNRSSFRDRHNAWIRSKKAIDKGKSLIIFPEGGIVTKEPPSMGRFKDGAFKVAIEKQIPIVPVTIPYNWIALFDENFVLKRRPLKLIYHKPIETRGMTLSDVSRIKQETFEIIDSTLKEHNREN